MNGIYGIWTGCSWPVVTPEVSMRLVFFLIPLLLAMAAAACSNFTPKEAPLVPSESLPVENLTLGNPTVVVAGESIPT